MGRQLGAPTQGFHGAPEPRDLCHTLSPWRRRLGVGCEYILSPPRLQVLQFLMGSGEEDSWIRQHINSPLQLYVLRRKELIFPLYNPQHSDHY